MNIHYPGKRYFIPPFEWYNDSISAWSERQGFTLFNFTPGLRTAADYTTPDMKNYRSSAEIYSSLLQYESSGKYGLNGFIILVHIGTDPRRTDKFYTYLPRLIEELENRGYRFRTIPELLDR
jgi:peptidoglycan/xylan/chitin deacetylase (PgdA/CDA1 family)